MSMGKSILRGRRKSAKISGGTNSVFNKADKAQSVLKTHGKKLCNNNFNSVEFKTAYNKRTEQYIVMAYSEEAADPRRSHLILTSAKSKAEADEIINILESKEE